MIDIRVAENSEGDIVQELVKQAGLDIVGADWSDIAPYWLIGRIDGEDLATVQVCPAKPIGSLKFLAVQKGLSNRKHALLVAQMTKQGFAVLARSGVHFGLGLISFSDKTFKAAMKKRGGIVVDTGNMVVMPIGDEGWLPPSQSHGS